MKYSWVFCLLLFSGPAFAQDKAQGKGHGGSSKEEKGPHKKGSDKSKEKDKDRRKDGEREDVDGRDRAENHDNFVEGSQPGEDGDENEEPGIDSGEAPRDTLTQQRNESEKHLRRLAKIQRLEVLGAEQSSDKLKERAKVLREKELTRHKKAVKRLETKALEESK